MDTIYNELQYNVLLTTGVPVTSTRNTYYYLLVVMGCADVRTVIVLPVLQQVLEYGRQDCLTNHQHMMIFVDVGTSSRQSTDTFYCWDCAENLSRESKSS